MLRHSRSFPQPAKFVKQQKKKFTAYSFLETEHLTFYVHIYFYTIEVILTSETNHKLRTYIDKNCVNFLFQSTCKERHKLQNVPL